MELERLVADRTLWPLERLLEGPDSDAEFFAAYAQAASFTRFVAGRYGDRGLLALWEAGATTRSFDAATRRALGVSAAELYAAWLHTVLATAVLAA